MKSIKYIKQLFGKFKVTGDADMDDRICADMQEVMRKSKPVHLKVLRSTIKTRMLAAAVAAVIVVGAIFGIKQLALQEPGQQPTQSIAGHVDNKTGSKEEIGVIAGIDDKIDSDVSRKESPKEPETAAVVGASPWPAEMEGLVERLLDPESDFDDKIFLSSIGEHIPTPAASPELSNEFVSRLKGALLSEHVEVRRRGAVALDYFGDKSGVEVMVADMETEDAEMRGKIADALRTLGDIRSAGVLIKATDDKVPQIRCTALMALGEMKAEGTMEILAAHLDDKNGEGELTPAAAACRGLGSLGDRKSIPILIETLDDEQLNDEACKALRRLKDGDMMDFGRIAGFAGRGKGTGFGEDLGCERQAWEKWWAWENLEGQALRVRWYKNWKADPAAYEIIDMTLKNYSLNFDTVDANSLGVIVILAEDQENEIIGNTIADRVYMWPYKKGLSFRLDRQRERGPRESKGPSYCFLMDALDKAELKGVTVEIFVRTYEGVRVKIGEEVVADSSMRRKVFADGGSSSFELIVSHPDYGIAKGYFNSTSGSHIILPLLSKTSEAADRRIWGYVVDEGGKAIAGAEIVCSNVRTLGEGLINARSSVAVLTDSDGYFSMYMPVSDQFKDQRGSLIPPGSTYHVKVRGPENLTLREMQAAVKNGIESVIVMKYLDITELVEDVADVEDGKFRRLTFVGEYGEITDVEQLKLIGITIYRKDKPRVVLKYDDFKDGNFLPDGRYEASTWDVRSSSSVKFEPLEVGPDSGDMLVFGLPLVTYSGQVIHGITGDPMPGVFVMAMWGNRSGNLSQITSDQWDQLHKLGANPSIDDPALKPLAEIYSFEKIMRTDENGRYEIVYPKGENPYGFICFEENYIGVMHNKYYLKVDDQLRAKIPVKRMFPAARVFVEPKVEGHVAISPKWIIREKGNPAWVKDLLALDNRQSSLFTYDKWLDENVRQSFYVPAGVNMKVRLQTPYEATLSDYAYPLTINLAHGEVLDIGECRFDTSVKVFLKVVDSSGTPVEGVPVRISGSVAHNTDSEGRVQFYIPSGSKGKFTVHSWASESGDEHMQESADFDIAGPEDEGSEYTLKLSDEIIKRLFKKE